MEFVDSAVVKGDIGSHMPPQRDSSSNQLKDSVTIGATINNLQEILDG